MTFEELYNDALSRELGSSDTLNLFTTARRKAAINLAQRWFIVQTECLVSTASIALDDEDGEYDLEAEIGSDRFIQLATRQHRPRIECDPGGGGAIVYLEGRSFQRRSVPYLDQHLPGWRSAIGTPDTWYETSEGGQRIFGMTPAPDIPSGATWTLKLPYVVLAADMSADADEPFTVSSNPKRSLIPWHDALAKYAAHELEKLRKGLERSAVLLQMAESRVLDYFDKQRVPGGAVVQVARSYRREARRGGPMTDYGNPWDDPWK